MQYFSVDVIKESIKALQTISANWLIPPFVFAANDVGTDEFVDLSKKLGTDQFLDRYFNGSLLSIPPFPTGNNLLRPRLKGIRWDRGNFANDYVIRQDTKMWGNLFSSRGYREMRLSGYIEAEKTNTRLTPDFQAEFETQIPPTFQFEDLLVWLFAFTGFPDQLNSWEHLYNHLLNQDLGLNAFREPYRGRFSLTRRRVWPATSPIRLPDDQLLYDLAPRLATHLATEPLMKLSTEETSSQSILSADDAVLATIQNAINRQTSLSFLLAGPPGTGKTKYAHDIADFLTDGDPHRTLFLQFHPAFGYDDFVEGFRPSEGQGTNSVTYILAQRHFLTFADKAREDPLNKYVLVIDELNRGDVARIFGELLTYLEFDYRDKEFTLAISGKKVSLPRNLIVLATANPFDRSVTDLDDALLRRFIVIMLEPDRPFLHEYLKERDVDGRVLSRTLHLFDILNKAFPAGFGHTNFLSVRTLDDLANVWAGRVQLGLQRALFHDRPKFDDIKGEVETLLQVDEEKEATGEVDPEPVEIG